TLNCRAFAGRFQKGGQILRQELDIVAGAVLEDESESAGVADTRNSGRGKPEGNCRRQLAQFLVEMRLDRLKLFGSCRALIPGLERDKKERVVTGAHKAEQTETDDAG